MIFSQVCINLGPALQEGGWVGGGEGWVGVEGWEGGGKTPQVKTRGHQSPPDGPEHSTRPKGHHSGLQASYTQLVRSTGANVSVMVLQDYKFTPQKSRPIESGHGRHAVQVANVCSYKLG